MSGIVKRGKQRLRASWDVPEDWCADTERRAKAKIPAQVSFQTKPQLPLQMLERAWANGVSL